MTWHPPRDLVERYARGRLDPVLTMSVESHLARCPACRAAVPYEEEWLTASWERIEDLVDRPRPRLAARLLCRFGVPEHVAVFLAATPALARGWLAAMAGVLGFAVAAARFSAQDGAGAADALIPFLVAAPLLPLAGIAAAYGRHVDPAYELQAATPLAGWRALLLRALAVLCCAVALTGAATPLLPGPPGLAAAWLLPALALTAAALALSTRFAPPVSVAALAAGWSGAVAAGPLLAGDLLLAFSPGAQALYALAAPALLALVYLRRARLDPGETR
ncbi:zf-HC2 domain-containing protein [Microtetraspora malaysiensis]|uniref:zf-HC2 domain-containing protein n=1 Tax=Microtetraspora malaysiensis TaxID=161358 RepID=UPI003D91E620